MGNESSSLSPQPSQNSKHIDALPNESLGLIVRKLPVIDRLHCERVCRRWNWVARELGWTEQTVLSRQIVFGGDDPMRRNEAFTNESLVALFRRAGDKILQLNLQTFLFFSSVDLNVCRYLGLLTNLKKLDFIVFKLDYVDYLPQSLREIDFGGSINERVLLTLSANCPALEAVTFGSGNKAPVSIMNSFIRRHSGLKKLGFYGTYISEDGSKSLTAIGELKWLEELHFNSFDETTTNGIDMDATFRAIVEGCPQLQRLHFDETIPVSEEAISELARLPNLIELEVRRNRKLTEPALKAIARRGKLKKLAIPFTMFMFDTIDYVLKHCKSLVTLNCEYCPLINWDAYMVVVTEVARRHEGDSRLPKSPVDDEIFLFVCNDSMLDWRKARNEQAQNPWLKLEDPEKRLYNRKFHP